MAQQLLHMAALPALGSLRVPGPRDLLRIGIVATAGFRYSPLFQWERPYHEQFPDDTLLSYRSQFMSAMKSNDFIVLVAEDDYLPDENNNTTAIISPDNGWTPPQAGDKVIVGVVTVKLDSHSSHKGQLKDQDGTYPTLPDNAGRDINRKHYDSWGSLVGSTREKYFKDPYSIVSMIVVHPAYWKRGHGGRMARWAVEVSKADQIPQCVSSATMSEPLFRALGFELVQTIVAEGDEDDAEGVRTALLKYTPERPSDLHSGL